jgi:hypothetical protein
LAVLAPNDKTQISFAVSKSCPASGPLLVLEFVLRTLDDASQQFQDRVKLEVTVGNTDNPEAEAMANRGLSTTQLGFLQGPITSRATALAQTGQGTVQSDKKLEKMIAVVPQL